MKTKKHTRTTKIVTLLTALMIIVSVLFAFGRDTALANFVVNAWQGYKLTSGLVGYWSFDGNDMTPTTALDKSGNANTGTLTSTVATIGKNGQALTFNGTSSFIDAGNPSSLNLSGANKFTLSAWVYPTSAPQGAGVISEMYDPTNTSVQYEIGFGMDEGGGGSTYLKVGFYDGTWRLAADTVPATLNEWVFISGTWDGTTLSLYKNGALLTSTTPGSSLPSTNYDKVVIGRRHDAAGSVYFFPGKIDEPRIYNRALSADEIKRLYLMGASLKTNVTHRDELTSGLVGYWTFDGKDMTPNVRDVSGQGNHGGLQNQTPTTTDVGKIGQGVSFDGSDDDVDFGTNSSLDISGAGAISVWFKQNGSPGGSGNYHALVNRFAAGGYQLGIYNNGKFFFWNGGSTVDSTYTLSSSDKSWHHYIATSDGTTVSFYVDGVAYGTGTKAFSASSPTTHGLGEFPTYSNANGIMDDVRIYNRALSADEIKRLYLMGASLKTNVSHRDELTAGLVGYWTFDGRDVDWSRNLFNDVSTSAKNATSTGMSTSTSPREGKIGQALYFDGVAGRGLSSLGTTLADDYTISVWVKPDTLTGNQPIIQQRGVVPVKFQVDLLNNEARMIVRDNSNFLSSSILGGNGLATGTWSHIVGVRKSSEDLLVYVNGVAGPDGAFSFDTISSGHQFIGKSYQNSTTFLGNIDEARVYNRALSSDEIKRLYFMGK